MEQVRWVHEFIIKKKSDKTALSEIYIANKKELKKEEKKLRLLLFIILLPVAIYSCFVLFIVHVKEFMKGAVFVWCFFLNELSIGPLSSHRLEPELIQWWRWWLVSEIFLMQTTTVLNFGVWTPWSISTAAILKQFWSWKSNCRKGQCDR